MSKPPTESPQLLVNVATAAKMLALSPRTVWSLTASGELPAVKIGKRCVRYRPEDLRAWVASKTEGNPR